MKRLLNSLSHPIILLGLFVLVVTTAAALPVYLNYRHTQLVIEQVEPRGGTAKTELPEWFDALPTTMAERCRDILARITVIGVDDVDDSLLADISGCDTVQDLYFGFMGDPCDITDEGLRALNRLKQLKRLFLDAPHVTNVGFQHIGQLSQLELLIVESPLVTDDGLRQLADLRQLESLTLVDCQITGRGLAHLHGLGSLENLQLRNTPLNDEGKAQLSGFGQLRVLSFREAPINDGDLVHLFGLTNLEYIGFSETDVSPKGIAGLAEQIGGIYSLDFSGSNIGDEVLEDLLSLPSVIHLDISDTKLSDAGADRLEAAFPDIFLVR